jgi:hypothetical protein
MLINKNNGFGHTFMGFSINGQHAVWHGSIIIPAEKEGPKKTLVPAAN